MKLPRILPPVFSRFLLRGSVAAALLTLSAFLLLAHPSSAGAQLAGSMDIKSALPPPPAAAIAARYASIGDYAAAVKKLGDITSSATYKNTPYAAEAFYSIAHLQEDKIHNNNDAMTSMNALVNNFGHASFTYPHQSVAVAERDALGQRIDAQNHAAALRGPANWGSIPSVFAALLATGYAIVDFFVRLTGSHNYSYWFALLLISVIIRLLLYPLSIKQYKGMKEMQRVQPLMKELQAKYKNDRVTLQAKQMELYKEHQINPAAGCLPMLAQLPIFYFMYNAVRLYQYKFNHGTFLWINPISHRLAPTFLGANLSDQDIVLLALYAGSMYVTQRMMPVSDPQQAEMQKSTALMSAVLFFVLFQNYHFPSAFVLYWLFSNVVSTIVQLIVMRQSGYGPSSNAAPVVAGGGGTGALGRLIAAAPGNGAGAEIVQGQLMDGASTGNGASNGGAVSGVGSRKALTNGSGAETQGTIAAKVHPKKKRR